MPERVPKVSQKCPKSVLKCLKVFKSGQKCSKLSKKCPKKVPKYAYVIYEWPHSNRESRVSFGSLASSSRGSSNNKHHPRTRSRSQDDDDCDYSSDHGGDVGGVEHPPGGRLPPGGGIVHRGVSHDGGHESVHGGGGGHHGGGGRVPGGGVGVHRGASHDGHDDRQNLSSSLPTPPPPPFCSQRDLIRHQASLLETINQKMAFLSAFKLPPAMTPNPMVQHQQAPPGKCDNTCGGSWPSEIQ